MFEQLAQHDMHVHDRLWDMFNVYAKAFDKSRSDNSDDLLDTIASGYNVIQKNAFVLKQFYEDHYLKYVMSGENVNSKRRSTRVNYSLI